MKKLLTIIWIMALLLTGCGAEPAQEAGPSAEPQGPPAAQVDLLKEEREASIAEDSEDILYEQIMETLTHAIPYEELERLRAEKNCVYAVSLTAGTELEYLEGCTLRLAEERTVIAVKYGDRYYISLPFYETVWVNVPEEWERTEDVGSSPNRIFTAEEEMVLSVAENEVSEYLGAAELKIAAGAECRMDLLFEKGIGHLCDQYRFSLTEEQLGGSRLLTREDLLVVWYEKDAEDQPEIEAGQVVYRLRKDDADGDVLVGGGQNPAEDVPAEYLYPVEIGALKEQLPPGEYAFITYGNYCSVAPENSRLGLVRAENKMGERNETAVYFEVK